MRGLLILLIVSASYAYPETKTWTFHALEPVVSMMINTQSRESENLVRNTKSNPGQKALTDAFNEMMLALYSGKENYVQAIMLSPSDSKVWTKDELITVLTSKYTDPVLRPWLEHSFAYLRQQQRRNGTKQETIEVAVPTLDISTWTENELKTALNDLDVKPDLIPYLSDAQKKIIDAKEKGEKLESVKIITPVGVIPKPDGELILFVARPVQKNVIANHKELLEFMRNKQQSGL